MPRYDRRTNVLTKFKHVSSIKSHPQGNQRGVKKKKKNTKFLFFNFQSWVKIRPIIKTRRIASLHFPGNCGHDGLARVAFRFGEEQNILASAIGLDQRAFLQSVLGSSVEFHGRANRSGGGQASFHFSFQFSRRRTPRQRKQFGSSSYAVVIVRIGRVLSRSCYVLRASYSLRQASFFRCHPSDPRN